MAHIQVGDLTPRNQYTATASQTTFTYSFPIFAGADLKVYVGSTLKTLTTDYTVTGAGADAGGTVVFVSGLTAGDIVTIQRDMAISRTSDYQANGDLLADTLNDDLDKNVMMAQQNESNIERSIRQTIDDTATDMELPVAATRATKALGFDSNGNVTVSTSTVDEIDSAVGAAIATGTLATAYQFTGDGATVAFTITGAVTDIPSAAGVIVDIDGVTQHTDTYTVSGATVTLDTAPPNLSDIQLRYNAYLDSQTINATTGITYGAGADTLDGIIDSDGVIFAEDGVAGIYSGSGNPENNVVAAIGSIYQRTDAGDQSFIYFKESGSGNTGWIGAAGGTNTQNLTNKTLTSPIVTGNITLSSTNGGIDFSANTDDEAGAGGIDNEVLDDYEEGDWVPVISDGTNDATMNGTFGGRYTKIGNTVFIAAYVVATSMGSVTTNIHVKGLPFAVANTNDDYAGFGVGLGGNLNITAGHSMGAYAQINQSYIPLVVWDATTGTTGMPPAEFSDDGAILIHGQYRVD